MNRFFGILEAAALSGFGLFMVWLALAGPYWHYLNPRFEMLTGISGVALFMLGGVRLFVRSHGVSAARGLVLLAFLSLCVWSVSGNSIVDMEEDSSFSDVSGSSLVEDVVARESYEGLDYVRMNVAEVISLLQGGDELVPKEIVLRGMLVNGKNGKGGSSAVLSRVAIVCCLADAVGGGIVLGGEVPEPRGQWVKVYGRFEKSGVGQVSFELPGVIAAVVPPGYRLRVDRVEECDVPAVPFIFEFREKEPFAY